MALGEWADTEEAKRAFEAAEYFANSQCRKYFYDQADAKGNKLRGLSDYQLGWVECATQLAWTFKQMKAGRVKILEPLPSLGMEWTGRDSQ